MGSAGRDRQRAVGLLVAAGVMAVVAGAGVVQLVSGARELERRASASVPTRSVLVASRTLHPGVPLTVDDVFRLELPEDALPKDGQGALVTVLQSREVVVGQVPRERILPNELIRPERLARAADGVGLNAVVPPGLRAVSLPLRGADAVEGFLEPGHRVDVLVTAEAATGEVLTTTPLQGLLVLAVGDRALDQAEVASEEGDSRSVTLLVTPGQAERVAWSEAMGDVSLTLRHLGDLDHVSSRGADLQRVLGLFSLPELPRTPAEAAAQDDRDVIWMIRGAHVDHVPVEPSVPM